MHEQAKALWHEVMTLLRDMDTTMLIHNPRSYHVVITTNGLILNYMEINRYISITELPYPHHGRTNYVSAMTTTICHPIHEFKHIEPTFVYTLNKLGVFIWGTNLEMFDMVEVGMFLGLNPTLTNVEWRNRQISANLGFNTDVPVFELYRRQLTEVGVLTNTIVLRCKKQDMHYQQMKILNLRCNSMGENVEFIPYHVLKAMKKSEKKYNFFLQNQHIADHGAVAFQGVPEEVMLKYRNTDHMLLHWFLEQPHTVQVENLAHWDSINGG